MSIPMPLVPLIVVVTVVTRGVTLLLLVISLLLVPLLVISLLLLLLLLLLRWRWRITRVLRRWILRIRLVVVWPVVLRGRRRILLVVRGTLVLLFVVVLVLLRWGFVAVVIVVVCWWGTIVTLLLLLVVLGRRRLILLTCISSAQLLHWTAYTDILVSNVIWHIDFDIGQVPLHLLLHHGLHKDPALALKPAVSTVHHAEDALAQRLLHFADEVANLAEQLRLDVVAEAAVRIGRGVAVKLLVKGVSA